MATLLADCQQAAQCPCQAATDGLAAGPVGGVVDRGHPIPTLLRMAGLGSFRALAGVILYASEPVMSVEELAGRMGGVEPGGRGERV
ncbi:MAG: hypothetical protein ACYCYK_05750 [Candidatus Dormibacteria bacterium]